MARSGKVSWDAIHEGIEKPKSAGEIFETTDVKLNVDDRGVVG